MMKKMRAALATLLIVCLAGPGLPLPVHAGMLPTQAAVQSGDRERLANFLEREEVRQQLQARGVDPAAVHARVAALSDEEAAQLAQHMDSLPAGGILGVLLFLFLLLLVTDILGLTKVFPFTRPVR